ncbi:methyltransferase [Lysinibacter sp. HNR]|uniref:DUF7059 domain-containing protein n=1 Tax=Lysinibacter sp. HNR TaxID=3031408 RepID=UPI002434F123|nr:methyltransferase [Lysinibacter sp. HNR]WGD36242.1 methyltransferase [Lysinibacter sp. HNR]
MNSQLQAPPLSLDKELIGALRTDLKNSRYNTSAIADTLGTAAEALQRSQRVPSERALTLRRKSQKREAIDVLIELFTLGNNVRVAEIDNALPTLKSAGAEALGLITRDTDEARALVDLVPFHWIDTRGEIDWIIASDQGELSRRGPLPDNFVLGVGGATRTLAGLMISSPADSLLDLGTGCGVLAMIASRYVKRVVATDISPRALRFAAFNVELNLLSERVIDLKPETIGVSRPAEADLASGVHTSVEIDPSGSENRSHGESIEFRLGSLFQPVAGERFERIVSNPPFVITPRNTHVPAYEYRDGGMVGDALIRSVVEKIDLFLTPHGVAQLLGNWEYRADEPLLAPVREWLAPTERVGWVIERERQTCDHYAETWIRDGGHLPRSPDFDRLYRAWLEDFDERRVIGVGFGYLIIGEQQVDPWLRLEALRGQLGDNPLGLGVAVEEALDAVSAVAALSKSEFEALTLVTSPDVTEHRHYIPGEEHPAVIQLVQGGRFGRTLSVDTALAACVGACDGELRIGPIVAALAQLLEVDAEVLGGELHPRLRELIIDGFLVINNGDEDNLVDTGSEGLAYSPRLEGI